MEDVPTEKFAIDRSVIVIADSPAGPVVLMALILSDDSRHPCKDPVCEPSLSEMSALAGLGVALVKGTYELCRSIQHNSEDANHTLRRLERHQELVNELLREQNDVLLPPEYAAIFDEIQVSVVRHDAQSKSPVI
jgi:hypothetical protein